MNFPLKRNQSVGLVSFGLVVLVLVSVSVSVLISVLIKKNSPPSRSTATSSTSSPARRRTTSSSPTISTAIPIDDFSDNSYVRYNGKIRKRLFQIQRLHL